MPRNFHIFSRHAFAKNKEIVFQEDKVLCHRCCHRYPFTKIRFFNGKLVNRIFTHYSLTYMSKNSIYLLFFEKLKQRWRSRNTTNIFVCQLSQLEGGFCAYCVRHGSQSTTHLYAQRTIQFRFHECKLIKFFVSPRLKIEIDWVRTKLWLRTE